MRILSVDVGVHNMAFYIEEFNENEITTICDKYNIYKTEKRYDQNGLSIGNFKKLADDICNIGDCVFVEKLNLSDKKGNEFDIQIFINLTYFFDQNKKLLDSVDIIVIEQQLKTNPMAQRIEQHCISWFTFNYLDTKEIIVFSARNKYIVLGLPRTIFDVKKKIVRKISKNERKKWACDVTFSILKNKQINHNTNIINSKQLIEYIFEKNSNKKDDISDTICQLNAFKIKRFLDKKIK